MAQKAQPSSVLVVAITEQVFFSEDQPVTGCQWLTLCSLLGQFAIPAGQGVLQRTISVKMRAAVWVGEGHLVGVGRCVGSGCCTDLAGLLNLSVVRIDVDLY